MTDFGNGLLVALGIGLLIFIHELGHYLAARWIGAQVQVFSLGFGPRLVGIRRGPTDYRLSLIPLGGYVAVAGQDPNDGRERHGQGLQDKTVGQRALFYSGGVLMNLLFALIVFPIAFHSGVSFPAPVLGNILPGSPAWQARLQPGDRILSIGGKPVYSFENLVVEAGLSSGKPLAVTALRDGQRLELALTPRFSERDGLFTLGAELALADKPAVLFVTDGGPASTAGLRDGDLLIAVNGKPAAASLQDEVDLGRSLEGGLPIEVTVRRGQDDEAREFSVRIEPDQRPSDRALIGVEPLRSKVAGIRAGSPLLDRLGLLPDDVVLAVDGAAFVGGTLAQAQKGGATLQALVRRNKTRMLLASEVRDGELEGLDDCVALQPDFNSALLAPLPGGAAEAAGIQAGDRLLRIDGKEIRDWPGLQAAVRAAGDNAVALELERPAADGAGPGVTLSMPLQPRRQTVFDYGYSRQLERRRHEVQSEHLLEAVQQGSVCALDLIKQLYVTTKRLLTGEVAASNLGGIIQISRVSYQNTQWGLPRFLYFLALLSINLAFANVLPVPVLDGGHLLFLLIERIKGSPVSVRVFNYSQVLGLVLVLALVVFVTYNDILRLL